MGRACPRYLDQQYPVNTTGWNIGTSILADRMNMSAMVTTTTPPEQPSVNHHPSHVVKPVRVLACMRCQQRKLKCERRFPCANCVTTGSDCVPTPVMPRQRRRRFTERELLDRIRRYEGLLQQNDIMFEPLHPDGMNVIKADQENQNPPPPQDTLSKRRNTDITSPITRCISSPADTL